MRQVRVERVRLDAPQGSWGLPSGLAKQATAFLVIVLLATAFVATSPTVSANDSAVAPPTILTGPITATGTYDVLVEGSVLEASEISFTPCPGHLASLPLEDIIASQECWDFDTTLYDTRFLDTTPGPASYSVPLSLPIGPTGAFLLVDTQALGIGPIEHGRTAVVPAPPVVPPTVQVDGSIPGPGNWPLLISASNLVGSHQAWSCPGNSNPAPPLDCYPIGTLNGPRGFEIVADVPVPTAGTTVVATDLRDGSVTASMTLTPAAAAGPTVIALPSVVPSNGRWDVDIEISNFGTAATDVFVCSPDVLSRPAAEVFNDLRFSEGALYGTCDLTSDRQVDVDGSGGALSTFFDIGPDGAVLVAGDSTTGQAAYSNPITVTSVLPTVPTTVQTSVPFPSTWYLDIAGTGAPGFNYDVHVCAPAVLASLDVGQSCANSFASAEANQQGALDGRVRAAIPDTGVVVALIDTYGTASFSPVVLPQVPDIPDLSVTPFPAQVPAVGTNLLTLDIAGLGDGVEMSLIICAGNVQRLSAEDLENVECNGSPTSGSIDYIAISDSGTATLELELDVPAAGLTLTLFEVGALEPAQAVYIPVASSVYTVRPGDTIYRIARENGISVGALLVANPQLADPNRIEAGEDLALPGGTTPPPPTPETDVTHTVVPGETLRAIARRYGISLDDLLAANPQIANPALIFPGARVLLPAAATRPMISISPNRVTEPGFYTISIEGSGFTSDVILFAPCGSESSGENTEFCDTLNVGIAEPDGGVWRDELEVYVPAEGLWIIAYDQPQEELVSEYISVGVPSTYTVVRGDTLRAIAVANGITLAAILDANPQITNPNLIRVGQLLDIPQRAMAG